MWINRIESRLGPYGYTPLSTGHGAEGGNSSLRQQNKVQPSICVIFNNSCRENVFKTRTSSLVYRAGVRPLTTETTRSPLPLSHATASLLLLFPDFSPPPPPHLSQSSLHQQVQSNILKQHFKKQ